MLVDESAPQMAVLLATKWDESKVGWKVATTVVLSELQMVAYSALQTVEMSEHSMVALMVDS